MPYAVTEARLPPAVVEQPSARRGGSYGPLKFDEDRWWEMGCRSLSLWFFLVSHRGDQDATHYLFHSASLKSVPFGFWISRSVQRLDVSHNGSGILGVIFNPWMPSN
jgi:hypothetical protein